MSFHWRALLATGEAVPASELTAAGLAESFEDQPAAEAWLGEYFSDFLELGATKVELLADDEVVYQMSLAD